MADQTARRQVLVERMDAPSTSAARDGLRGLDALVSDMMSSDVRRINDACTTKDLILVSHASVVIRIHTRQMEWVEDGWDVGNKVEQSERIARLRRISMMVRDAARQAKMMIGAPHTVTDPDQHMIDAVALLGDGHQEAWLSLPAPWCPGMVVLPTPMRRRLVPRILTVDMPDRVNVEFSMIGTRPNISLQPVARAVPVASIADRLRIAGRQTPEAMRAVEASIADTLG